MFGFGAAAWLGLWDDVCVYILWASVELPLRLAEPRRKPALVAQIVKYQQRIIR